MTYKVDGMNCDQLLKELERDFAPKIPSAGSGWRALIHTMGQEVLAQSSARLIRLARIQQDRIEQLEKEITELKQQITHLAER